MCLCRGLNCRWTFLANLPTSTLVPFLWKRFCNRIIWPWFIQFALFYTLTWHLQTYLYSYLCFIETFICTVSFGGCNAWTALRGLIKSCLIWTNKKSNVDGCVVRPGEWHVPGGALRTWVSNAASHRGQLQIQEQGEVPHAVLLLQRQPGTPHCWLLIVKILISLIFNFSETFILAMLGSWTICIGQDFQSMLNIYSTRVHKYKCSYGETCWQ